jgi:hypothetical protein
MVDSENHIRVIDRSGIWRTRARPTGGVNFRGLVVSTQLPLAVRRRTVNAALAVPWFILTVLFGDHVRV